jgi:hypothetical protein
MAKYAPIDAAKKWFAGVDIAFQWRALDADDKPKDMSGHSLQFDVRDDADGTLLLQKKSSAGQITLYDFDPADTVTNDGIEVRVLATDTVNATTGAVLIPPGDYSYALYTEDPGDESLIAYGPAVLRLSAKR